MYAYYYNMYTNYKGVGIQEGLIRQPPKNIGWNIRMCVEYV